MRWRGRRESFNLEDRRGMDRGIPGRLPVGGRGIAGGGIGAVILIVLALVFGIDPTMLLQGTTTSYVEPEPAPRDAPAPADDDATRFVAVVLAETEDTWNGLFAQMGRRYEEPKLVVFDDAVRSACGFADAAVGPFYCPGDRKIYLDLSFFEDLRRHFGAPGDFAQAYVIAHEVGHHVQTLLGISPRVEALRRQSGELDANRLSVMMELQADCFAGVWAHRAKAGGQLLEPGDIEEALNAANAIGDDHMQARVRGYVVPDSFTHGSSAQRVAWFRRGLASGSPEVCDTFSAAGL